MRLGPKQLASIRPYPLVRRVFPATRTIEEAVREAGWIREEFVGKPYKQLKRACLLRGRGVPLQYVLGNTPFGDARIVCRPGVLIPRWETEEWAMKLAELMRTELDQDSPVRVLDLCSGTGCIPIALAPYVPPASTLYGADVSARALELFAHNVKVNHDVIQGCTVMPVRYDVLEDTPGLQATIGAPTVDLVTANPPYVYADEYRHGVDLSVRRFEPRLALIGGVEFYEKIYDHACALRAKAIVCEVGNDHQVDVLRRRAAHDGWQSVRVVDSAQNVRCVALWRTTAWEFLADMV